MGIFIHTVRVKDKAPDTTGDVIIINGDPYYYDSLSTTEENMSISYSTMMDLNSYIEEITEGDEFQEYMNTNTCEGELNHKDCCIALKDFEKYVESIENQPDISWAYKGIMNLIKIAVEKKGEVLFR